ncbi:MAG: glycosyltransferase family protein [Methyloligellaceae bacterium]
MARILFHVQYLKGIGHLQRVRVIAEAAAARGHEVGILCGGLPLAAFAPDGVTVHQLPALQAGPDGFGDLRDADGRPAEKLYLDARRDRLLELFQDRQPDMLVIEAFPFGRRQLSFELVPLLDAAWALTPRPRIVCSVRDILQSPRKPGRDAETVEHLRTYFDHVLVHGDPSFANLRETFAATDEIAGLLAYTGLVAAPQSAFTPDPDTPSGEALVSVGGGAVGPKLLRTALQARAETSLAEAPWRLLAGPNLPDSDFQEIRGECSGGVTVERFRSDFRRLLAAASLSISYAGYNTTLDVMRARVPAVLVTYSGSGGETEQRFRASRMAERGLASTLPDQELAPTSLARAIGEALETEPRSALELDLDGATTTADLLDRWTAS